MELRMAFCLLTFQAVHTFVRAQAHHDIYTMAFVLFVYFGYLSLLWCLKALHSFQTHEKSPKKELLKVAIWVLSTSLSVGVAIELAPLIHPVVAVFIFALAVVSNGVIFYFSFTYQADPKKKKSLASSPPLKVGHKEMKPFEPISPLENV